MALTPKQERFVSEYLIDLNATQAAMRTGYSEKTAYSQGQRLLKDVEIQDFIAEAQANRAKRTQVTADMVVRELARIGFSDLRKVLSPGGSLLMPTEWDDDTAASIASIEVVTNTEGTGRDEEGRKIIEHTHKIKVWDKNSALEKLAKHLGMFVEKHVHTGDPENPLRMVTEITLTPVKPKTLDD
jgi:phage terminase small subunit